MPHTDDHERSPQPGDKPGSRHNPYGMRVDPQKQTGRINDNAQPDGTGRSDPVTQKSGKKRKGPRHRHDRVRNTKIRKSMVFFKPKRMNGFGSIHAKIKHNRKNQYFSIEICFQCLDKIAHFITFAEISGLVLTFLRKEIFPNLLNKKVLHDWFQPF